MKNIIKNSIFALLLISLGSCTESDVDPVAVANGGPKLSISAIPSVGLVLSPANATNLTAALNWEHSDNGVPSASTYTVEIAKSGTNFESPIPAGTTTSKFFTWTNEQLNNALSPAIFTPYVSTNIDIRVKSSLGNGANAMLQYSNIITVKVTPYSTALPKLYVIGNFITDSGYGSNWTPSATIPALASSGYGKTNFEGYVYINVASAEYKFLPSNTSFDGDFADDGSFSGVLVQTGESNCTLSTSGYYWLKANTGAINATTNPNGLTYSATPISTWGIIGDATANGWDSSTAMTFNPTTKKWSITMPLIGGKQVKFRSNNTWNVGSIQYNLGSFDASKTDNDYGGETMSYNGKNIDIATSGTYVITLDLTSPRDYKYSIVLQ